MAIKCLVVDDHTLFRDGIRRLLDSEPDVQVTGEARDAVEALEKVRELRPDVVLMDIGMPGLNGIDATAQIASLPSPPKVIAVSGYSDRRFVCDILRAGASGYVVKEAPPAELVAAVRTVAAGQVHLSPQVAAGVMEDYRRCVPGSGSPQFATLSAREREVLQLMAEGKTTKQIASALHLSKKTVDTHRAHIMEKLGASSVAELVKHAIREGLTSVDA